VVARPDDRGRAELTVVNDWLDVTGSALLEERQAWTVSAPTADSYTIDISWELRALERPLHIARYAYGGLALRLVGEPTTLRLLEGEPDDECDDDWDRASPRLRWVSAAQPVDGVGTFRIDPANWLDFAYAGVAIFDHPVNGPTRWRLDGALINPSPQIAGPIDVPPGGSVAYRYRLVVFLGPGDADELERAYRAWLA
jgi:hypothetical protein